MEANRVSKLLFAGCANTAFLCKPIIPTRFRAGAAIFVGNASDVKKDDGSSDADAEFRSVFEFCDKDNVIMGRAC